MKKLGGGFLSQREVKFNFTTALGLAEMAVADGWETNWVGLGGCDEALEFLDKGDGSVIDGWADTLSGSERGSEGGGGGGERGEESRVTHFGYMRL